MLVDEFENAWIEYPALGRVGFAVDRQDGARLVEHGLLPAKEDYVMLR